MTGYRDCWRVTAQPATRDDDAPHGPGARRSRIK
jgi:hypothetical protein